MTGYKVENIDSEDANELLLKIERSFGIKFGHNELIHVRTFGEFSDHIIKKIQLDNANDCTTQQAFYKLRNAISTTLNIGKRTITTDFPLSEILPRQNRRKKIGELENYLDVQLNILRAPRWVTITLLVLLLVSIGGLFFKWQYGFLGFVTSIGGLWFANEIGNELDVQTVGQLAEKITRENYLKSRRNPKTFNKSEIEKVLTNLFINDLALDRNKLTRGSEFV